MASNYSHSSSARRYHRRKTGVPVLLAILLIIVALLIGSFAGFVVARKTDTHLHQLQDANERITQLENTLTMLGFSVDEDDPEEWAQNESAAGDAMDELSGENLRDDGGDDLWDDTNSLTGMLTDEGEPFVVAEFDGGVLMSNEFIPEYNDQLTTMIFMGYDPAEIAGPLTQTVMDYMVSDKLIARQAESLGLNRLNDEDRARIREEAEHIYGEQLQEYMAFVDTSGMSEEEARAAAAEYMRDESGITLESVTDELTRTWWAQKYYEYAVRDVAVTDEEIRAYYDELLEGQRRTYTEYPDDFEYDHLTGQIQLYHLEGYRAVRDILIPFDDDEDAFAAADLMEQIELGNADAAIQEQLDALYAPLEETAREAQDRLNSGEAFEALMDEYGCDDLLRHEPLRSQGYYVSEQSFINSTDYVEGSMLLEQPGQVSTPLRSAFGVHLVQYIGDVTPGDVPLEEVQEAMRQQALEQRQSEYYDEQRATLLAESHVRYYPERLH